MDSLRFLAQYDKEYRFLVATYVLKINQDGVDCKRAIAGSASVHEISQAITIGYKV
jgi:hypothetical protein